MEYIQDSLFGKTYPEPLAPTKARTSGQRSRRSPKSLKGTPLYLDLRAISGQRADASWEMGGPLHGVYSMHSFMECPRDAVGSRLSQILEGTVHPRYYLSAEACNGVLRRAERREKELPPRLKAALEYQSEHYDEIYALAETMYNAQEPMGTSFAAGFDAGAKAQSVGYQEEVSATLNAQITAYDLTQITSPTCRSNPKAGSPCHTLTATAAPPVICIQGNIADRGDTVNCNGKGWAEEIAYTLNTVDRHAVMAYQIKDIAPCLNCNHEAPLIGGYFCFVRRLTPLECERLQDYPDNWTNIPDYVDSKGRKRRVSDSARYKSLGNSIALPVWKWVLKRISAMYECDATLGSLFDGIGGFPRVWEEFNGRGSARWASEIEEFPTAVTKYRFLEEGHE